MLGNEYGKLYLLLSMSRRPLSDLFHTQSMRAVITVEQSTLYTEGSNSTDTALPDHCAHLQIVFTYLLTRYLSIPVIVISSLCVTDIDFIIDYLCVSWARSLYFYFLIFSCVLSYDFHNK